MASSKRTLRSTALAGSSVAPKNIPSSPLTFIANPASHVQTGYPRILPHDSSLPSLEPDELSLLRRKQLKLKATSQSTLDFYRSTPHYQNALNSTLIFAQYEAGTAVCVHEAGWLLTCSHCISETPTEWQADRQKWLLYYTGLAVLVECRAYDPTRDLALLKVIAVECAQPKDGMVPLFSHVSPALLPPKTSAPIFCLGQPGADDLESETKRKTKYNLIEVSEGRFRGMVKAADPHDNSRIGTLKHDAWTYWGHSGAPLLCVEDGTLMGLHSSWDEETAMRYVIL